MDRGTGGVSVDEIRDLAEEVLIPATFSGEPIARFLYAVSQLANARREKGEEPGVTVLLLSEALPATTTDWPANSLLRNGYDAISGKLILTNSRIGQAFCRDLADGEEKDLHSLVSQFGYEDIPALVIDWRGNEPMTSLYRNGLAHADLVDEVHFFENEIRDNTLKAVMDSFYKSALRTPQLAAEGNKAKVWSEASKGIPVPRAESVIQGELIRHLGGYFGLNFLIRSEVPNTEGRADVVIYEKRVKPSGKKYLEPHWQLELKALREKTSSGKAVGKSDASDAIEEGLSQAMSFGDGVHANSSGLCCFDMRKTDLGDQDTFADICKKANDNEIRLWRWFLFRSASEARKHANA